MGSDTGIIYLPYLIRGGQILKVAYDSQIFLLQKRGGISTYFADLILEFTRNQSHGIQPVLLRTRFPNLTLQERGLAAARSTRLRSLPFWDSFLDEKRIRREGPDLIHRTFYHQSFLRRVGPIPVIDTLYDMIPELFGERGQSSGAHLQKLDYLRDSDGVISISQTSLDDAKRLLPFQLPRSSVIHLGISKPGAERDPSLEKLSGMKFWLYIGERGGYKNWEILLKSVAQSRSLIEHQLVFASGREFSSAEKSLLGSLNLLNRSHQINADLSELEWLLINCLGLVFTSKYEGFGYPPLEALSRGVPTLIAKTNVSRELLGDEYPGYFDPDDSMALSSLMREIELLAPIARRAAQPIKERFSVEKMASETASFYREVAGKSNRE